MLNVVVGGRIMIIYDEQRLHHINITSFMQVLSLLFLFVVIYSFKIDKLAFLASRGSLFIACMISFLLHLEKQDTIINKIHFFWVLSLIPILISCFIPLLFT